MKLRFWGSICLAAFLALLAFQYSNLDAAATGKRESPPAGSDSLPTVGSYDNLMRILKEREEKTAIYAQSWAQGWDALAGSAFDGAVRAEMALNSPPSSADTKASAGGSSHYSTTNVQVEGVDEADIIKTDGDYIYALTHSSGKISIAVIKAYPADDMRVVSRLEYDGDDFSPSELYLDGDYLVALGSRWGSIMPVPLPAVKPEARIAPDIWPGYRSEPISKAVVYDLKDKANPQKVREVEIDGYTLSSRKVGDILYIVSNKNLPYYQILREEIAPQDVLPVYKDSVLKDQGQRIDFSDIAYFPGCFEPNYLIIAALDLSALEDKQIEIRTYLGAGQNIYASTENLFVALPEYSYPEAEPPVLVDPAREPAQDDTMPEPIKEPAQDSGNRTVVETEPARRIVPSPAPAPQFLTNIYKFALDRGDVRFVAQGQVPGTVLNQFSMDESGGYFRIATTTEEDNNLYILDPQMVRVGSLEKLAPGERIYSARFIGSRAYMVTFRTVDPLFVLDLHDPQNPKVLGQLKIPGYSNYLHPYDENHLIGIGKDAIEVEGTAYYLGMKIALFDVSDVSHPLEKFKVEIGDRGTESEVLWNHKALLWDQERNLLALPITVASNQGMSVNPYDYWAQRDSRLLYGVPIFQGAYVYELTPEQGFRFRGGITHHPTSDLKSLYEDGSYNYQRDVSRILYIEDTLYTFSNSYLRANVLPDLASRGFIKTGL